MGEFTMPSLGADMDEGTLLEWRVAVGDHVDKGDIVAVVDTEKSTIDVEVFESGVVEELLVQPGTTVAVGTPLARLETGQPAETTSPTTPRSVPKPASVPSPDDGQPAAHPIAHEELEHDVAPHGEVQSPILRHLAGRLGVDIDRLEGSGVGGRVTRADVEAAARPDARLASESIGGSSPWARRQAAESGVDLHSVVGSGPGGAVRARDLDRAAPSALTTSTTSTAPTSPSAMTGTERKESMRRAIARLMTTANREIPHYHLSTTTDLHAAMTWLDSRNEGRPNAERVLPAALLLRATALAAAQHPELNGFWVDDGFRAADGVHLGVAISLRGGGLVAPAILNADQQSLDATMSALKDLVARARQGSLRSSEMGGASLTVTNLGDRGAEAVFGVIYPPQVALVGFGRIVERPCAVDGLVGVRPMVTATLSADHRATDGHVGSRLLETIDDLLQRPADL